MKTQSGAVLVTVLVVLAGVAVLSLSAARSAVVAGQSARAALGHALALASAQAALEDAEAELSAGPRASQLRDPAQWPRAGCGTGPMAGVCAISEPPAWRKLELLSSDIPVDYGRHTGRTLPVGAVSLPARLPRYLVEVAATGQAGDDAGTPPALEFRITAVGYGPDARIAAVVQSTFRPVPP